MSKVVNLKESNPDNSLPLGVRRDTSGISRWTSSQEVAIEKVGQNLLVSASAGSGKTTILVERIANTIENGGDVRRLVVLTFTKDAAAEMKERVLQEVLKRLRNNPTHAHLKEQVDYLPFANIATIDGYCLNLVRRYFNELEEESAAEILSEDEEKVLLNAAADTATLRAFQEGTEEFYELLDCFTERRDVQSLKEIIFALHRFLNVQAEKEEFLRTARNTLDTPFEARETTIYLLNRLKRRAAKFQAALVQQKSQIPTTDQAFSRLLGLTETELFGLATATDFYEFSRTAENIESITTMFRFDKVKNAFPEEFLKIKALRTEIKDFLKDMKDDFSGLSTMVEKENSVQKFSAILLNLAADTDKYYRALKKEKGKLDFNDVEQLAYRVLSDNTRRAEISSEIDAVYLDEYQDTNDLQESILTRLSTGDNLFMVGDPKQAIYRFRLAEPKIFVKKYRRYTEKDGGEKVDLNENFRSDPRILAFVNDIFNVVMTPEFGGVDYVHDAKLISGRKQSAELYSQAEKKPVEVCLIDKEKVEKSFVPITKPYSVKKDESETDEEKDPEGLFIANKIKEILGEPYYDAKANAVKQITLKDIAVLAPKNKNAATMRATFLKEGIPATLSGKKREGENPDVLLLKALLSATDNRQNDIPLLITMASPLFGFSAKELTLIREAIPFSQRLEFGENKKRAFWESVTLFSGDKTVETKIKRLYTVLDKLCLASGYLTVKDLFALAISETEYDAYIMGKADGAERLQKLNLYCNGLGGKEYAFSLKEYLKESEGLPTDVTLPATDSAAVRVMTFHASKGLEFPVVFVTHAGDDGKKRENSRTLFDKEFGVAVKYFEKATAALEDTVFTKAFREKETVGQKEEALRLVYVALTRAKNRLFVVAKRSKGLELFQEDGSNFADWFAFATSKNPMLNSVVVPFRSYQNSRAGKETEDFFCKPLALSSLHNNYPHQAATALGVKYTVSELNTVDEDFVPTYQYGGGGKEEGILYHKVLQHISFDKRTTEDVREELTRLVVTGILLEEEAKTLSVAKIATVLSSTIFDVARKGQTLREQPFMLYVPARDVGEGNTDDKILLQGVIDLLVLGEENIVVDYKDTALSGASAVEKYKKQLTLYALAAERILGIKIHKKVLCILNRSEFIEVM